jgi:ArsR family transcriptional regulator
MIERVNIMKLVKIIKSLAHENRLRILNLLRKQSLCVCELRNIMNINQSNASRHLRKLKNANLIDYQKEAQWVHYKLIKNQILKHPFIAMLLEKEFEEPEIFKQDLKNLQLYNESEISCENIDNADIFH